jgi:hypothetical protein
LAFAKKEEWECEICSYVTQSVVKNSTPKFTSNLGNLLGFEQSAIEVTTQNLTSTLFNESSGKNLLACPKKTFKLNCQKAGFNQARLLNAPTP